MRIIYLHPHFTSPGGAGRAVLETGARLAARGHQVDCICIRADPEIVGNYVGIQFHEIGGPLSSSLWFWITFYFVCRKVAAALNRIRTQANVDDPCILYPQVFPANWWASLILKDKPKLKCVWYCQEPSAFIHSSKWIDALSWPKNWIASGLHPLLKRLDIAWCQRFSKVLVNSEFSRSYAKAVYGFDDDRCEVVSLGVDHERFFPASTDDRMPWITTVAKLTRFKNVDRIIATMQILITTDHPDLHLHIVGNGDALPSLQSQVRNLGLDDHVTFHSGATDDQVATFLRRSRVFCLASVDEPFGLVAVEAMACGTPVVAVNAGGPKEIIGDSNAGILAPDASPDSLAVAIRQVIGLQTDFQTMSEAAVARAQDFDWDQTADRLEAIFLACAP